MYVTESEGASTKLNTVSSTDKELDVAGEKIPGCVQHKYFQIEQNPGFLANEDHIYQDNKSIILLMNNRTKAQNLEQ